MSFKKGQGRSFNTTDVPNEAPTLDQVKQFRMMINIPDKKVFTLAPDGESIIFSVVSQKELDTLIDSNAKVTGKLVIRDIPQIENSTVIEITGIGTMCYPDDTLRLPFGIIVKVTYVLNDNTVVVSGNLTSQTFPVATVSRIDEGAGDIYESSGGSGGPAVEIADSLTDTSALKALAASQGKVLKDSLDALSAMLTSDDVNLNELQEVVNYIKTNRGDIDALGISSIIGLQTALDDKATVAALGSYLLKADVVDDLLTTTAGKALSANQGKILKDLIDGLVAGGSVLVVDNLLSNDGANALSANQGLILKGMIDNINTLLSSNDTALDNIQEIVDYIKVNSSTLATLNVSSIAGLQAVLDSKSPTNHSHADLLPKADVIDTLTSVETGKALSAAQGKVLKDLVDSINAILTSDNVSLNELQEIVDFIEANKATLDGLGISSIIGLETALNGKQPLFTGTPVEGQIAVYRSGQWTSEDMPAASGGGVTNSTPKTAGATLEAAPVLNELQDSSAFNIPPANSVAANDFIDVTMTESNSALRPSLVPEPGDTVNGDTVVSIVGAFTLRMYSDGVDKWRF